MHTCAYCDKEYRYKKNLRTHETLCQFMQSSLQERNQILDQADDPIPTLQQLYHIIQQQSLRIDKLEQEQQKLKSIQKRKMNVHHWLQSRESPTLTFPEWIHGLISRVPTYIEIALRENLYIAMTQLFEAIENVDHLPICVFDHKPSKFYVYRANAASNDLATWELFAIHEFDLLLQKIAERFYIVFVEGWYAENKANLMNNDVLYDQFIGYQRKVSATVHYGNLRHFIYTKIKRVIGTITELEMI